MDHGIPEQPPQVPTMALVNRSHYRVDSAKNKLMDGEIARSQTPQAPSLDPPLQHIPPVRSPQKLFVRIPLLGHYRVFIAAGCRGLENPDSQKEALQVR
ncbi:hypothetical protein CTA1_6035 [Colletotrichum tanaceti]|uniref:Uncharacterized protein n=1 Tax=Colletotrichum tanaceti TaxID=1306861 RepID=A0A4U6X151_9PEZI|nr:hypothetical protein CTA1_6035 [Colletotrichum tanaceti]